MTYVIDTSVAIELRDDDTKVAANVAALSGVLIISAVTRVELEGGVHRDKTYAALKRQRLDLLLQALTTIPFDEGAAIEYGRIVAACGYSRRKILDRMIAAQALTMNATLVTLNASDFSDVPNLRILAW